MVVIQASGAEYLTGQSKMLSQKKSSGVAGAVFQLVAGDLRGINPSLRSVV